jgi:hypothetical protein
MLRLKQIPQSKGVTRCHFRGSVITIVLKPAFDSPLLQWHFVPGVQVGIGTAAAWHFVPGVQVGIGTAATGHLVPGVQVGIGTAETAS